jgi:hypothetical protein
MGLQLLPYERLNKAFFLLIIVDINVLCSESAERNKLNELLPERTVSKACNRIDVFIAPVARWSDRTLAPGYVQTAYRESVHVVFQTYT